MISKKSPIISIIIATFNSEKTLTLVLESIKKQTFPKDKIEVLLVDGGSKDTTKQIAAMYDCKVINNPRTEPVYAKFLGYLEAKGKYLMYLDHDEVIENTKSLELKHAIFVENQKVKAVICSGYKSPKNYPMINNYINEFGDPFSAFIYNLSKDARFFLKTMIDRYGFVENKKEYAVFDLHNVTQVPLIELCAGGSMFDGEYMKDTFKDTKKSPNLIPHFFYLLNAKESLIAMTKGDSLVHYSSDTLGKYFTKIRWRIKNNIYHVSDMGASGFSGREQYSSKTASYKKYLFIPYVYTIFFCLYDAIYLAFSRKSFYYLIHFPLCFYTATLIIYHTVLKLLGHRPHLRSYDDSVVINKSAK